MCRRTCQLLRNRGGNGRGGSSTQAGRNRVVLHRSGMAVDFLGRMRVCSRGLQQALEGSCSPLGRHGGRASVFEQERAWDGFHGAGSSRGKERPLGKDRGLRAGPSHIPLTLFPEHFWHLGQLPVAS